MRSVSDVSTQVAPSSDSVSSTKEDYHTLNCAAYFNACLEKLGIRLGTDATALWGQPEETLPGDEFPLSRSLTYPLGPFYPQAKQPSGCVTTGCTMTRRTYFVKLSSGGHKESSLLLEAKALREADGEDVRLPLLFAHFYDHMSSTHLLVIERATYGCLTDVLKFFAPVPLQKQFVAKIMMGVSRALHFLHVQNILHGSVIDANVLVDDEMVGRLGGLSTARMVFKGREFENTYPKAYRTPDADRSKFSELPQDMFAVGVVLYRMIFGSYPKRKPDKTVNFDGVLASSPVPVDKDVWRTIQLLLTEKVASRLTAGDLLFTSWVERAKDEPINKLILWNVD